MNWVVFLTGSGRTIQSLFEQVGFMIVPEGPAGRKGRAGGIYWSIFDNGDKQKIELAKDFVKYWFDTGVSDWLALMGGYSVPGWEEYKKGDIWEREDVKVFAENSKYCVHVGWPGAETAAARDVNGQNVLVDMVNRVLVDKWTYEEAIAEAENRIKEIYAKYY